MTESSRREKDLPMTEEFEYVRGIDPNGRSVNVPKSLFGGNLDVASEEVLGGVKASPKSETDTTEVKIDPNTGKLYCPPSEVAMATAEKIGGIVADVKTSEETEEVKIDPNTGKAYVKPSSKLEVATAKKLGGVKAETRTEAYTVEAKIDEETGKLYVPEGEDTPPDEEDITVSSIDGSNALRFKNRDTSNGMGYVILRKNKSLAEQLTQSNTIYEVRYDFDLNGGTVEVPSDCVLDFRGGSIKNGRIVFNKTKLTGLVKIESSCTFEGFCINPKLNVKEFGAKGNGVTDDTDVIRNVIKLAYTSSYTQNTGYRDTGCVYFPQGTYLVTRPIVDGDMEITYMPINFVGEGYRASKILSKSDILFDNQNVFGYSTFSNIAFDGYDNNGTFMYINAGGTTQGIEYENCLFTSFHTVIECDGTVMGSEITFNNSKISWCGTKDNMAELFIFNDLQGVNWRFYATDIDTIYGTVLQYKQGANVSFFQGSIILMGEESKFVETLPTSVQTSFGEGNAPHLIMYSSRFELRGRSYLIHQSGEGNLYTICFRALFIGVGMGGYNISTDTDFYPLHLIGIPKITFYNCHNIINYKLWYRNSGNMNADGYIDCINCGDLYYYLYTNIDSNLENTNLLANGLSIIKNSTQNVLLHEKDTIVKSFVADSKKDRAETTKVFSFSAWENVFMSGIPAGEVLSRVYGGPMIVSKITYYNYGTPGSGGNTITINVYSRSKGGDKGDLIAAFDSIALSESKVQEITVPLKDTWGIIIEVSHTYTSGAITPKGAMSVSYF